MKKISFGNREFVKASEIAKQFKYTQDYVGQLCRGEKVDARLVGRVWYVNPESVTEYRKTKHATQKQVALHTKRKKATKKSKVEAVIRPKTARTLHDKKVPLTSTIKAKYSKDDVSVIPVLQSDRLSGGQVSADSNLKRVIKLKTPTVKVKVRPATKKSTNYVAAKKPEITLKSKLKVEEMPNVVLDINSPATSKGQELFEVSSQTPRDNYNSADVRVTASKKSLNIPRDANFTPGLVATKQRSKKIIYVCLVVLMLASVLLILSIGSYTETESGRATSGSFFQTETLSNLLDFSW